jgi:large subunit ribosomal protein L15
MPLYRRIARRGFSNKRFRKQYQIVNLLSLERKFADGETVTVEALVERHLIKKRGDVKILGKGSITKKLKIAVRSSRGAENKIIQAGGQLIETSAGAPAKVE